MHHITGGATANSTKLTVQNCTGTAEQYWSADQDGSLYNYNSNRCLDDPGQNTTNGTQLQIYDCNGTAAQSWNSPVRSAPPALVGTIIAAQGGGCVDNTGGTPTSAGSTTDGNKIQIWTCNGYPSQQWTIQPNGTITIAGKCMDNTHSGTIDGNKIQLWTCNGTSAQQWQYDPTDDSFWNPSTNKCVDVGSGTQGTQLQIWTCNQTKPQQFVAPY